MNNQNQRLQAYARGRVQGVGFRYFVRQAASELELTGWVRNLHDGRVELLAEGPRSQLEKLLGAVQRGPGPASVQDVTADWGTATGEFSDFGVKGTV